MIISLVFAEFITEWVLSCLLFHYLYDS